MTTTTTGPIASDEHDFRIRTATPDDAEALCTLIEALAEYERLRHEARPDPDALRRHLSPGACPRCEALLAETPDGQAIGFALYFHTYSTFLTNWGLYLEDLFVQPAHRGQGVGLGLLRRLAHIALDRGCERVEWAVLDWNQLANDFYHRLGAVPMDGWTTMRLTGEQLRNAEWGFPNAK